MCTIQVIGIKDLPVIDEGNDLAELICKAATRQGTPISDGDVIVIAHIVVSRAEGNVVDLDDITPSHFARAFAQRFQKDPALVEVVLRESNQIVRMGDGKLIVETKHGIICANAGVDRSNVPKKRSVALLPRNPDHSAQRIRQRIKQLIGREVGVIVSDTHGRPLRKGEINVAIGIAGISPIRDRRGERDLFGYTLRVKGPAIADELASAAELVMGQADEGIPAAIVRGYSFPRSEKAKATQLIRSKERDLFA